MISLSFIALAVTRRVREAPFFGSIETQLIPKSTSLRVREEVSLTARLALFVVCPS